MGPLTSQITQSPRTRRIGRVFARLATFCLALATTAWVWGINWWVLDLCANLAAQLALIAAGAAFTLLIVRRWRLAIILSLIALLGATGPFMQPRLPRARAANENADLVSILVFNGSSGGLDDSAAAFEMLETSNADIIVLLEPSLPLLDSIRASAEFSTRYPYRRLPASARAGWRVVFTRWPHRGRHDFTDGPEAAASHGMHVMVVDRPGGPFGLVQFNPESPRTLERHRAGNRRVREAVDAVNSRLKPLEIPILAAGDMNATPTGWRSRHFAARTGLRRAKPSTMPGGTFPSWAPRPARLAIDDVWGSPGVTVEDWMLLASCGSDHHALLVRLRVPVQRVSEEAPPADATGHSSSSP